MNRGGVCARFLNIELQAALNLLHGRSAWLASHRAGRLRSTTVSAFDQHRRNITPATVFNE